jgi:hypothetical protein
MSFRERSPPMGPSEDDIDPRIDQVHLHRSPRARQCLLKGCSRTYSPKHPLQRYCSEECRRKAREWRLYKAQQQYRQTDNGKKKRGEQCQRRRELLKTREAAAGCQSHRCEGNHNKIIFGSCCDRPGCYERFIKTRRSPMQRFCSHECRRAFERVLERERRWIKRGAEREWHSTRYFITICRP